MNRRQLVRGLIAGGAAFAAAAGIHGYARGIRFPVLQAEPDARPNRIELLDPPISVEMDRLYLRGATRREGGLALDLRAFAPECAIRFTVSRNLSLALTLRNIAPAAVIEVDGNVSFHTTELTTVNRTVGMELSPGTYRLVVRAPFTDRFRFAFIGDTGGGSELAWCLRRAVDVGADFLLHAGDFYYSPGDFRSLPRVLENAPLPMYSSIGNHDFHGESLFVHREFTRDIGPRNSCFALGETMFVNFDTAASTWPVSAGDREALFDAMAARRNEFPHWVLMTHRPLHDPRFASGNEEEHALAGREVGWVSDRLKALTKSPVLLAGHIHVSAEHEEDGIHTFISGDGLGNRNLVSGRNIARILVGDKRPGEAIDYQWVSLEMPAAAHCHDKGRWTLNAMGKPFPEGSFGAGCGDFDPA